MLRHILSVFVPERARAIEADANELSAAMLKKNHQASAIAALAARLNKSMDPIVKELNQKLQKGVPTKHAVEFIDSIVKDVPYLLNTDIRSAEQAVFAINSLVSEIAQNSSEGSKKELSKAIDSLAQSVERPERFDPKVFSDRVQELQKLLNRQRGQK
jgi:hypothetical protein